jgi:hypothetical protein
VKQQVWLWSGSSWLVLLAEVKGASVPLLLSQEAPLPSIQSLLNVSPVKGQQI